MHMTKERLGWFKWRVTLRHRGHEVDTVVTTLWPRLRAILKDWSKRARTAHAFDGVFHEYWARVGLWQEAAKVRNQWYRHEMPHAALEELVGFQGRDLLMYYVKW